MNKNRSHGIIDRLPEELRRDVEGKLLDGETYKETASFLNERGIDIHPSSVYRFGRPFLKKFEAVRMAKEFAQLLAEDNAMRPTTELHEANNALVSQMVMETLIDESLDPEIKLKAARSIANLQQAQVSNERLKLSSRKEAGAVKTALEMMKTKVFEELAGAHPELAKIVAGIADDIERTTHHGR
jgi:hypothetical protein